MEKRVVDTFVVVAIYFLVVSAAGVSQTVVREFPAPAGDSRGLAWDGSHLWCSDYGSETVYRIDPTSGDVVSSFSFSFPEDYGGLAWSQGDDLWIAAGNAVYEVKPTGEVVTYFTCPGG